MMSPMGSMVGRGTIGTSPGAGVGCGCGVTSLMGPTGGNGMIVVSTGGGGVPGGASPGIGVSSLAAVPMAIAVTTTGMDVAGGAVACANWQGKSRVAGPKTSLGAEQAAEGAGVISVGALDCAAAEPENIAAEMTAATATATINAVIRF